MSSASTSTPDLRDSWFFPPGFLWSSEVLISLSLNDLLTLPLASTSPPYAGTQQRGEGWNLSHLLSFFFNFVDLYYLLPVLSYSLCLCDFVHFTVIFMVFQEETRDTLLCSICMANRKFINIGLILSSLLHIYLVDYRKSRSWAMTSTCKRHNTFLLN